jgi:hypothetical protein
MYKTPQYLQFHDLGDTSISRVQNMFYLFIFEILGSHKGDYESYFIIVCDTT